MTATAPGPSRGYPHPRIDPRIRTRIQVGDETWSAVQPLIPPRTRRPRHNGGRRPVDDRAVLAGILTILANRVGFEALPVELGYGSGMTCWRRLRHWHEAGAWPAIAARLREILPPGADIDLGRVDALFAGCGRPRSRRTPIAPAAGAGRFGDAA
jgi:transposase